MPSSFLEFWGMTENITGNLIIFGCGLFTTLNSLIVAQTTSQSAFPIFYIQVQPSLLQISEISKQLITFKDNLSKNLYCWLEMFVILRRFCDGQWLIPKMQGVSCVMLCSQPTHMLFSLHCPPMTHRYSLLVLPGPVKPAKKALTD